MMHFMVRVRNWGCHRLPSDIHGSHLIFPQFDFVQTALKVKFFHSFSDPEDHSSPSVECTSIEKPSLPPLQHSLEADSLCQILIRHHNPFHHMESSIQLHGISLSPHLVHQTLLRLNHHSKIALAFFKLTMMKEKGICPSVATYTSVVKCLCSCARMDDAEELLNEMLQYGVTPTAETYNCFFKEYRGRKDVDGAMKLYRKMKEGSLISLNMHTYNILLRMLMVLDKMGPLWEVWDDMCSSGIGPDLDAYTILVHGLCEKRKWRRACEFFVEMIEKGFLPQKFTFETLYRGLIQADMLRTWRMLKKKLEEESISFGSEFKEYQFNPYKR